MHKYTIYINGHKYNVNSKELVSSAELKKYPQDALVWMSEKKTWILVSEALPIIKHRLKYEQKILFENKVSKLKKDESIIFKRTDSMLTSFLKVLCLILGISGVILFLGYSMLAGVYTLGSSVFLAVVAHILSLLERKVNK